MLEKINVKYSQICSFEGKRENVENVDKIVVDSSLDCFIVSKNNDSGQKRLYPLLIKKST